MGLDGIHPRVLKGAGRRARQTTFNKLPPVLTNWRGPICLEFSEWDSSQQRQEGGFREFLGLSVWPQCQRRLWAGVSWMIITQHMQDNWIIRWSLYGFMKGTSCLTNLTSLYDKMMCSVGKGKSYGCSWVLVKCWALFPIVFPWESGCSWLGQVYGSLGEELDRLHGSKL